MVVAMKANSIISYHTSMMCMSAINSPTQLPCTSPIVLQQVPNDIFRVDQVANQCSFGDTGSFHIGPRRVFGIATGHVHHTDAMLSVRHLTSAACYTSTSCKHHTHVGYYTDRYVPLPFLEQRRSLSRRAPSRDSDWLHRISNSTDPDESLSGCWSVGHMSIPVVNNVTKAVKLTSKQNNDNTTHIAGGVA